MMKRYAALILLLMSLSGCTEKVEANDPMPVDQSVIGVHPSVAEATPPIPDKEEEANPKMQSPVAFD